LEQKFAIDPPLPPEPPEPSVPPVPPAPPDAPEPPAPPVPDVEDELEDELEEPPEPPAELLLVEVAAAAGEPSVSSPQPVAATALVKPPKERS